MIKENVIKYRNRMVALLFLGILSLMLAFIIVSSSIRVTRYISKEDNEWDAAVYYPLENDDIDIKKASIVDNVLSKIESFKNKVEKSATSSFSFRMPFVLVKKACDKALGLDMTTSLCAGENNLNDSSDIVLVYEDDYLGFIMDDADVSEAVENLIAFGSQMKNEERNFLFFMSPEKYRGNEIYQDYSEEKKKEVMNAFEACGLDLLCIPEIVDEEKMASLFFKTDHHWLPSSGIWADKLLCEFLNQEYGYNFDTSVFNMDNYEIDIWEGSSLGSLGKKVTEVYSQRENFPIILPRYDTDLQVFISSKGETSYGTIEDTLLDYSAFNKKDVYSRKNYDFYGYNDQGLIKIHNNNIHDGSNILIVKTSFADCMYPYLAAIVEDLNIIDLRHYNGSLQSYIQEADPDTVIVIYGLGTFSGNEISFDFR